MRSVVLMLLFMVVITGSISYFMASGAEETGRVIYVEAGNRTANSSYSCPSSSPECISSAG